MKIYLAGPLFTAAERRWNDELAFVLRERHGFEVFLPQEFSIQKDGSPSEIFLADKQAIDNCDAVVANLDGTDPDSGTAWELGYAFALGKDTYWYRTDFRLGGDSFSSAKKGSGKVNLMLSVSAEYLDVTAYLKKHAPERLAWMYTIPDDVAMVIALTLNGGDLT